MLLRPTNFSRNSDAIAVCLIARLGALKTQIVATFCLNPRGLLVVPRSNL